MKCFINLSLVLVILFTIPLNAAGGDLQDESSISDEHRNRMIEILPAVSSHTHRKNMMGEIGEGTTFNSYYPTFALLCATSETPHNRLLLEVGNEQIEFSRKYKFLSQLDTYGDDYPLLSGIITAAKRESAGENKRYFDIIKSLEEYGKRYFYFDGKSPNLLVVSIKLLGNVQKEIFLGVFVSGGDSCKLLVDGRDVSYKGLTQPLERFTFREPERVLKQTNSHAMVFKALSGKLAEYKDHQEYIDFHKALLVLDKASTAFRNKIEKDIQEHRLGAETFSHAPIFEFKEGRNFKLSLSPVSRIDLYEQPSDQLSDLYKRLTQIFLEEEFDDLTKLAEYADSAKKIETATLVDHRLIDAKSLTSSGDRLPFKEKGCLHSGLTDCFSDSEQAFLSYLDHATPKDMTKAPVHLNKETLATPLCGITHVELRLLSTKDICKFCRATLSKSLASSILRAKLSKYLNSQGIIAVEELDANIPITILGYSRVAIANTRR